MCDLRRCGRPPPMEDTDAAPEFGPAPSVEVALHGVHGIEAIGIQGSLGRSEHAFAWASAIAAAALVAGNCALLMLGHGPGAEPREA